MKNIFSLSFVLLACITMHAQTFTGNGGPIPSEGTPTYYSINIETLGTAKLDTSFGVVKVGINVIHTDDVAVEAILIAPDGTQVVLTAGNGNDGNNFTNTYFDDRAKTYITAGAAPFTGTFRPNEIIGSVNNGQSANGIWKLLVRANWPINFKGTLLNWSITFGNNASGPNTSFTSSNLPIVMLNTNGIVIPNDPKIPAGLIIINNGPGKRNNINDPPQFEGYSGVETRGSTAQLNPKKSYGIEIWDVSGNDIDASLLGMPGESDWILNAGFTDKSLIRNALSYKVWQNMGHYATRYQLVDLVINGQYKGVYTFSEKIKRDKDRVNIAKLDPNENAGDSLTGGYIIKIDKKNGSGGSGWTSAYLPPSHAYNQTIFFQYEYPDEKAITPEQKNYIQNYVTDFETALNGPNFADTLIGFRKYAIESTFIDYFLINEISKNVDGYHSSTFLHKQRDNKGGKLRMGPIWDYDLAWNNANFCGGNAIGGWAYQFPCGSDEAQVPFWWSRLLKDTLYTSHLKCRWESLRKDILSDMWFDYYIDSIALQLDEAQKRNYEAWNILGLALWSTPWPIPSTYQGEISSLKTGIHNRLAWLDKNMPGKCDIVGTYNAIENVTNIYIYPNPFNSGTIINWQLAKNSRVTIKVIDMVGRTVVTLVDEQRPPGKYESDFNGATLPEGVYLCQLKAGDFIQTRKMILIK